jgi:hypothetical protein
MIRHTLLDEYDDFDDVDELDGFHLDPGPRLCYGELDGEPPVCLFDIGDKDGLCIKERYGCRIEGCPHATPND